jgi:hypothetical protein
VEAASAFVTAAAEDVAAADAAVALESANDDPPDAFSSESAAGRRSAAKLPPTLAPPPLTDDSPAIPAAGAVIGVTGMVPASDEFMEEKPVTRSSVSEAVSTTRAPAPAKLVPATRPEDEPLVVATGASAVVVSAIEAAAGPAEPLFAETEAGSMGYGVDAVGCVTACSKTVGVADAAPATPVGTVGDAPVIAGVTVDALPPDVGGRYLGRPGIGWLADGGIGVKSGPAAGRAAGRRAAPARNAFSLTTSSSSKLANADPLPGIPALTQRSANSLLSIFRSLASA